MLHADSSICLRQSSTLAFIFAKREVSANSQRSTRWKASDHYAGVEFLFSAIVTPQACMAMKRTQSRVNTNEPHIHIV